VSPNSAMPEGGLPENDNFATFISLAEIPVYPRTGQPFPITQQMIDLGMFIDANILAPLAPLF